MHKSSIYSVHERLAVLENFATETEKLIRAIPHGPAGKDGKDARDCQCQNVLDEVQRCRSEVKNLRAELAERLRINKVLENEIRSLHHQATALFRASLRK